MPSKRNLCLLLLPFVFFISQVQAVQISGNAFLDNTSNHSGIKILFVALTPSAQTDSVLTASDGSYSINVNSGYYDVLITKTGYQPLRYALNSLISTPATFNNVTLISAPFRNVTGNASGTWDKDTCYVVVGNVTVPQGATLNIEAGTVIKFDGLYDMYVNGKLMALGTNQDKILFTSNRAAFAAGDWGQLRFNDSSDDSSILTHAILEFGGEIPGSNEDGQLVLDLASPQISYVESRFASENGVALHESGVYLHDCELHNNGRAGLYTKDSYARIESNYIYENGVGGLFVESAGYWNPSRDTIHQNHLDGHPSYGIRCLDNYAGEITQNRVFNCGNQAIGLSIDGNALVAYNTVFNSIYGISAGNAKVTIVNNTVHQAEFGIHQGDDSSYDLVIDRNVVTHCSLAVRTFLMPQSVGCNLFHNDTIYGAGPLPIGFGNVITTNSNGDDIDTWLNIYEDPEYASTTFGNPAFLSVLPGSAVLNGCNGTQTVGATDVFVPTALDHAVDPRTQIQVAPNPSSGSVGIRLELTMSGSVSLDLYDLTGRKVRRLLPYQPLPSGTHQLIWNGLDENGAALPSGVYLLRMHNGEQQQTVRLVRM